MGRGVRLIKRLLLFTGAFVIAGAPLMLMLYGAAPLSVKAHSTLKCYDHTQKQRPC